jgi:transcription elongation GreA/GreB family factor
MRDKEALKTELVATLTAALETAQRAHRAALEGATHSEARAENSKDTRGLEQSYLARGQAQRVADLETAVVEVTALAIDRTALPFGSAARRAQVPAIEPRTRVTVGALVMVAEDGVESQLFVAPHGGGSVLAGGVQVVTPVSPLGRALLGKQVGDEVEVALPGRTRSLAIVAVA